MSATADLVIVGAGPAGSACALAALQGDPDLRVVLVDRAEFPRDKVCGDGVGPDGLAVLDDLDVAHVTAGHPDVWTVALTSPSGRTVTGPIPRPGRVVPRTVLDARLHAAAVARGAEPRRMRVTRLDHDRDGVVVNGELRARWVVGADGANSVVRRLVGARSRDPRHTGLAIRGYANAPIRDLTFRFEATHWPSYGWAFPVDGDGLCNVGWGPFDQRLVSGRGDLLAGLARTFPDIDVDAESLGAHPLPLSTSRPRLTTGRVLLVGDAAHLVHPLTGEGIHHALLSGALAGAAVAGRPQDADRTYRASMRERFGRHLRHTAVAARLFRSPRPVDLTVAAAADNPAVLDDLAEFALASGLITPRLAVGLARRAARHAVARSLAGSASG